MEDHITIYVIMTFFITNLTLFIGGLIVEAINKSTQFNHHTTTKQNKDTNKMNVAFILFTDNDAETIEESLASLDWLNEKGLDVVVVDNASNDNTVKVAKNYFNKSKHLKGRTVTRRIKKRHNNESIYVRRKYIRSDIVVEMKTPLIMQPNFLTKIRINFNDEKVKKLNVRISYRSTLKLLTIASEFHYLYTDRLRKISHFLTPNNPNFSRTINIYRRNFNRKGSCKKSIYDNSIKCAVLNPKEVFSFNSLGRFDINKSKSNKSHLIKLCQAYFQIAYFISVATLLSIALLSVVSKSSLLFLIGWILFTSVISIEIYTSQSTILEKFKYSKHLLVSYLLFIIYVPYILLHSARIRSSLIK